jgi:hypothetical protein
LVVIGSLAAAFGVVGLTSHAPDSLAGPLVAQRIGEVLQTGSAPPAVRCPAVEPVRAGLVFSCTLVHPGRPGERVVVTETGHGDFRITPPGRSG